MLTVLTLTLALVAQTPVRPVPDDLARARSLAFAEVQIDWIASLGHVRSFDDVLDSHWAELLRSLDCDRYGCRSLAQAELIRLGDDAADALIWGTHDRGRPEVRDTCARLLSRLYVCRDCQGRGDCSVCRERPTGYGYPSCPARCNYRRECTTCDGEIDLRWSRMPYEDDIVPRDFFAKEEAK